jgi:hypothetical protein
MSHTDSVHRQIEDLQKYAQSQLDMTLMQQKQSLLLRQDLQAELDRCLRKTSTVLRDNRNRQYVQKLIIAQQYAQLQAQQASARNEQAQLSMLQSMLDTILTNQSALADQVTSLNTQLQESREEAAATAATATAAAATAAAATAATATAATATAATISSSSVTAGAASRMASRSSASLLAAALGNDDDNDDDDNADSSAKSSAAVAAAAAAIPTPSELALMKTLQDLKASQDAMRASLTENMPDQFRAGFDAFLPRLVAALESAASAAPITSTDASKSVGQ